MSQRIDPQKSYRRASRIAGTGIGYPSKVISNMDLSRMVDTSDEWILGRTGISERRGIDREKGQTFTSLAKEASSQAMDRAGINASDIDFVICATTSPDTRMPSQAARICGALGMRVETGALDIGSACAGFLSAIQMGDALLRSGIHQRILIVGGDLMSSLLDYSDRSTCVLFGDGIGAVVLGGVESAEILESSMVLDTMLYCEFDRAENLVIKGGGAQFGMDASGKCSASPYVSMRGKEVFKDASRAMSEAALAILRKHNLKGSDIDWLIPHQANLRILQKVSDLVGIPMDRVYVNLDRWGNTSAATIPICLAEMEERNLIKKGQLVLLDAFGGGYNYGACLIRW